MEEYATQIQSIRFSTDLSDMSTVVGAATVATFVYCGDFVIGVDIFHCLNVPNFYSSYYTWEHLLNVIIQTSLIK